MADITGSYDVVDSVGEKLTLDIASVDPQGKLTGTLAYVGSPAKGIQNGSFGQATMSIGFTTDPPNPRQVVRDYYTGQVIISSDGLPLGMFGTHHSFLAHGFHPTQSTWFAMFAGRNIG